MSLSTPFPEGSRLKIVGDTATVEFSIPTGYPYFEGHFPGNPLVPAVIQVGWATAIVGAIREGTIKEYRLSRFKFVSPIRPLARIEIRVIIEGGRYTCRTYSNGELCSSGLITLIKNV